MTIHKIYYGDCIEVLELLDFGSVQLIITSPPYYNARDYSQYSSYEEYLSFMDKVIKLLSRVLMKGCYFCLNSTTITEDRKTYCIPFDLLNIAKKYGFELVWDVIWMKPKYTQALWRSSDFNYKNPYPYKLYLNQFHEYLWIMRLGSEEREIKEDVLLSNQIKGKRRINDHDEKVLRYSYRDWNIPVSSPSTEKHPATFPIELPNRCIELFSLKNDLVLDCFLGSGTTSRSAYLLKRNSIGIEIQKKYFKLIRNKLIPNKITLLDYVFNKDRAKNKIEFINIDFNGINEYQLYDI